VGSEAGSKARMIPCIIAKPLLFCEDNMFVQYEVGTRCKAVTREEISDPVERAIIVRVFEQQQRAGLKPVVVLLKKRYRVIDKSLILTEAEMEKRKNAANKH
jgi:hypothetical protein